MPLRISSTYRAHIEHQTNTLSNTLSNTYRTHIEHQTDTKNQHIEHISSTKSTTKSTTKIPPIEAEKIFSCLSKSQKEILLFIYNSCKLLLSKTSASITIDDFANCCNLKKKSVKTTLRRLEKNNLIILRSFKRGRQGWRKYEVPENIYQEILLTNNVGFKSSTESSTKSTTNSTVVSSSNINKTTTTIPWDFKEIDLTPLAKEGFDESHIIQIYREYSQKPEIALSAEIIQNSINALAFDLKYNHVAGNFKNSPAVVLISLLKKGQPYSSKTPEKVLTPREEAMQEYLLAQEKKNHNTMEMEKKAQDLALQEWLNLLPEEELLKFNQDSRPDGMPEKLYRLSKKRKALETAKDYFYNVLWPEKLKQILNNTK